MRHTGIIKIILIAALSAIFPFYVYASDISDFEKDVEFYGKIGNNPAMQTAHLEKMFAKVLADSSLAPFASDLRKSWIMCRMHDVSVRKGIEYDFEDTFSGSLFFSGGYSDILRYFTDIRNGKREDRWDDAMTIRNYMEDAVTADTVPYAELAYMKDIFRFPMLPDYYYPDNRREFLCNLLLSGKRYLKDSDREKLLQTAMSVAGDDRYALALYRIALIRVQYGHLPEKALEAVDNALYRGKDEEDLLPYAAARITIVEDMMAETRDPEVREALARSLYDFSRNLYERFRNCTNTKVRRELAILRRFVESCREQYLYVDFDGRSASVFPSGSRYTIGLRTRNISSLTVRVYRLADQCRLLRLPWNSGYEGFGKTLCLEKTVAVDNPYMTGFCNTEVDMTAGNPGIYFVEVTGGDKKSTARFEVTDVLYSLRNAGGHVEAYMHDAGSGKPYTEGVLNRYTVEHDMDLTRFVPQDSVRMAFDGFTPVPEQEGDCSWINFSAGSDVFSGIMYCSPEKYEASGYGTSISALVYTDRPLYGFGDRIGVGGVVFSHDAVSGKSEAVSGGMFRVRIYSPEGKCVGDSQLQSDPYGSVSAFFSIQEDEGRAGVYRVVLSDGKEAYVGSSSFRIESYYIPAMKVELDRLDHIYDFSDTLKISGRAVSDVGASLADADVSAKVILTDWRSSLTVPVSAFMTCDADGRFGFSIPVKDVLSKYSNACRDGVWPDRVSAHIEIVCLSKDGYRADASFRTEISRNPLFLSLGTDTVFVDRAVIGPELYSSGSGRVSAPVKIRIGKISGRDTVPAGEMQVMSFGSLDISSLLEEPGRYEIRLEAEAGGHRVSDSVTVNFLKTGRGMPEGMDIPFVFSPENGVIRMEDGSVPFVLGTSVRDGIYVLAELMDGDRKLAGRIIHVPEGVAAYTLVPEGDVPEHLTLSVLSVYDGRVYEGSTRVERPVERNAIKVTLSGIERRLLSGDRMRVTLHVQDRYGKPADARVMVTAYNSSLDRFGSQNLDIPSYPEVWKYVPYKRFSSHEMYWRPVMRTMAASDASAPVAVESSVQEDKAANGMAKSESEVFQTDGLREKMEESLLFIPAAGTDRNGNVSFEITGGDLLSEFRLRVLAHTADMLDDVADTVFSVYRPLSVNTNFPKFLFAGDRAAFVIRGIDRENSGIGMEFFAEITDRKGRKLDCVFEPEPSSSRDSLVLLKFTVPEDAEGTLDIRCGVRNASDHSVYDAVKTGIEIRPLYARQYVSELKYLAPGEKWNCNPGTYTGDLVAEAVTPAYILGRTLSSVSEPASPTFVSALSSYISGRIIGKMADRNDTLAGIQEKCADAEKLARFMNSDGGFSWIPGFRSSFDMTLLFLEECAYAGSHGLLEGSCEENRIYELEKAALGYADRYVSALDSVPYRMPSGEILRYLAVRGRYMDRQPLQGKADSLAKVLLESAKNADLSDAGASVLLSYAELADIYGFDGLYRRAAESLKGYAVERDGYTVFPALAGYAGILDSKLAAHIRAYNLFAARGEKRISEGILRWMLTQGAFYDWGGTAVSLKVAELIWSVYGKDSGRMKFKAEGKGGTMKVSSEENGRLVWNVGADSDGFKLANTGNVPVIAHVYYHTVARVDSLGASCEGIKLESNYFGDEFYRDVEAYYRLDSPLYKNYIVLKGFSSPVFRTVDERSGFRFVRGVMYYREVTDSGVNYYFESLPDGVTVIRDELYDVLTLVDKDGRLRSFYTVASPTIFRE